MTCWSLLMVDGECQIRIVFLFPADDGYNRDCNEWYQRKRMGMANTLATPSVYWCGRHKLPVGRCDGWGTTTKKSLKPSKAILNLTVWCCFDSGYFGFGRVYHRRAHVSITEEINYWRHLKRQTKRSLLASQLEVFVFLISLKWIWIRQSMDFKRCWIKD